MKLARWLRHALRSRRAVDRALPPAALGRVEQAIAASEATHRGEIRLAVEAALPWSYLKRDAPVRQRAEMLFAKLRVWDTDERNGVLIYVELADRGIEIVADRGIVRAVAKDAWPPIVAAMAERFRSGDFEGGVIAGIEQVGRLLAEAFPAVEGRRNDDELPNRPVIVGR
jgi:uncharacterized membrane protein